MIDIKKDTEKLLKSEYGISETVTRELFASGILHEHIVRNVLIKHEYKKKIKPKEKNRLKIKLADKYCISFFSIEKILSK